MIAAGGGPRKHVARRGAGPPGCPSPSQLCYNRRILRPRGGSSICGVTPREVFRSDCQSSLVIHPQVRADETSAHRRQVTREAGGVFKSSRHTPCAVRWIRTKLIVAFRSAKEAQLSRSERRLSADGTRSVPATLGAPPAGRQQHLRRYAAGGRYCSQVNLVGGVPQVAHPRRCAYGRQVTSAGGAFFSRGSRPARGDLLRLRPKAD